MVPGGDSVTAGRLTPAERMRVLAADSGGHFVVRGGEVKTRRYELDRTVTNVVTVPRGADEVNWDVVSDCVASMMTAKKLSDGCVYFLRSTNMAVANSLEREYSANAERRVTTRDVGAGRSRVSHKDLMSEVERVLSKASGALSLLERL